MGYLLPVITKESRRGDPCKNKINHSGPTVGC